MSHPATRLAGAAGTLVLAMGLLAACAPDPGTETPGPSASGSATSSPDSTATPTPTPTSSAAARVEIPDDCRAILSAAVLAELDGVPLNDPAFGPSGPQADGSLICVWGDPAADTTSLVTTLSYMSRGPALDMLNALVADEGFTCYTPDEGTRCEKTWQNESYPVTDGRTLYWRDDVLIDSRYSNLAPSGYTAAIVASLFG
ncbi:hypothetical protein [Microbacterium cremeum]|uniref:hypothetical protein n=1 Tax=Microbacterium cremeum TaxID=2782169 RepID=UPI001886B0F4|nr:hypothetical protein [Microbacterium cremeum]